MNQPDDDKQIDLGPTEYRTLGFPRLIRLSNYPLALRVSGIAAGIWAGGAIGYFRYFVEGEPLWLAVAVSMAPLVAVGIVLLAID